jgi:hypothetical protein
MLAGCSSTGMTDVPSPSIVSQASEAEEKVPGKQRADNFRSVLERAVADPRATQRLRLFADCLDDGDRLETELFGNGVGIWNGERAFRLPPEEIVTLLRTVLEAGFAEMPSSYGGRTSDRGGPEAAPDGGGPVRILCEVEVRIGESTKRVEQLAEGKQSDALKALAREILTRCRERGEGGVGAAGLSDGLDKLSRGILPPEVFRLVLHKKPELSQAEYRGFLLRVRGRIVTTRQYHRSTGYGPPRTLELAQGDFERFTERMSELDLDDLPVNLFAIDYNDLSVEVLNHRSSVQARQFPGIGQQTHGSIQENFDTLVGILAKLERRAATEGVAAITP